MEEKGVVFDMDALNPGTWFDVENGSKICLRVCDGDALRDIRKKTTKKRIEYKQGQRFVIEDTDDDAFSAMLWDYCIVDWKNFLDKNKKPIPCNKQTKNLLMGKSAFLARLVGEKIEELTSIISVEKEEEEKN